MNKKILQNINKKIKKNVFFQKISDKCYENVLLCKLRHENTGFFLYKMLVVLI